MINDALVVSQLGVSDPPAVRTSGSTQDFDGLKAVTKVETKCAEIGGKAGSGWTETVTISLTKVGAYLLPTNLQFEHVFSKDWGPEVLSFKGLKLK